MNEQYSREAILGGMQTKYIGRTVHFYDCTDSTNIRAGELAVRLEQDTDASAGSTWPTGGRAESERAHGHLVVADTQTAGKGRRGRSWESPAGKNIYFSLLLKPDFAPDKAPMLTLVMAMAVLRALQSAADGNSRLGIKWPNDIVMDGKKVCGILTEMGLKQNAIDYVVIGVGINVHNQEFAPELVDKAAALDVACGKRISRKVLLAHVTDAFETYYDIFMEQGSLEGLRAEYEALLVNCGREVCVLEPRGEYRGVAKGITDTGELLVELPDGSVTEVYAGEVSVRGIYGYV